MRTTVDIPERLLREAMRSFHLKTKTKAIILGLEELLRRSKIEGLRKLKGKLDIEIDLKASRKR